MNKETTMTMRIITRKQLREIVPWTPQHVLRMEKAGKFPKRIRLSGATRGRVGWLESEIIAWINARKSERAT